MKFWLIIFTLLHFAPLSACVMKVQVNEFPPYSYFQDQAWQGSRVVLSERLAAKLNCQVEYLDAPFGRALKLVEQGELDFIFNLTKTDSRNKTMLFLAPHQLEVLVVGVHKSYPEWLGVNSLAELLHFPGRIALTKGSYLGVAFEKIRFDPRYVEKFIEVADRRAKNELVVKGRAQGVIEEQDYLRYAIENFSNYQNIVITPLMLSKTPVYLALSRKSSLFQRQEEINQAIIELQKADLWPHVIE
ncbi:transporter substrate-binding domain-containing protein [Rheinheimera riviphila]|uniref:Transporter substrate-binding domain-containing protein n=1 Tax=Rheinheimera riviphila TaxID=1834037 RepID=A0A437QSP2_9GAMM|nr:transporter substrate-binding domain-containing protein [Rheinheimera riviphila]RVU37526.1 transporter substrate-binding domain-containing protein [Rheinheimera riviphila]